MEIEFEIKILNVDKNEIRNLFASKNCVLKHPERLMRRKTFDIPSFKAKEGEYKWLRIRDEGDKVTTTIKHVTDLKNISGTRELELEVSDFDMFDKFVNELGIIARNYQENYREEWKYGEVSLCLDTWPGIEPFLEIEAPNEELVRKFCSEFGFDFKSGVLGSVDVVYEKVLNLPLESLKSIQILTFESIS